MDDVVNRFARELADAIAAAVAENSRVEACREKARAAGLETVMDRCVKIEHGRLFGGLIWVGVNTRVISAKRPRWLAY